MIVTIAIVAFIAGSALSLAAFGMFLVMAALSLLDRTELALKSELRAERSLRTIADTELSGLKASMEAQTKAIEANALPWVAKNDKLEARYETEALENWDKVPMYYDAVDGLGGTR